MQGRPRVRNITVNIDESPAKEEVAGGWPYDEVDDEYDRKIQTVRPIKSRLWPFDPWNHKDADVSYTGHGDYTIEMMNSLNPYCENKQEGEGWNCN